MKIKKINENSLTPTIAYDSDAGFDVYACSNGIIKPKEIKQIKLGIAIEIEKNEVAIMSERSGMAIKYGITSIGNIIDAGYRGEISIILLNGGDKDFNYNIGDKIGQIIVCRLGNREIIETNELSDSERNNKAHYSSGI